jgi:4-aminobutyrate aminotransferase-like enzyme
VHPHALKAQLARELSELTFGRWAKAKGKAQSSKLKAPSEGKVIFCNSGFEAVEAALKTARLATGRAGIIAFEGGYHGLGYGALNATHREHFRGGFRDQLREFAQFVPFPQAGGSTLAEVEARLRSAFAAVPIGAILVEPIQARGGIHVPPAGFLPLLRRLADEHGTLLILDEIYTGFGRTGAWFACEHAGVIPDLICLGKALTGGFPLSACVGRADVMDAAWPVSNGEAIHTSTFLGHPVGCAMALAQITELKAKKLVERTAKLGAWLTEELISTFETRNSKLEIQIHGRGLMVGVKLLHRDGQPASVESLAAIKEMLQRGFILLPEGEHANVIAFTPPLTITEAQLRRSVRELARVLKEQQP